LRRLRVAIDEIHDLALVLAHDSGVRAAVKSRTLGSAMVARRHPVDFVHALLHDSPLDFGRDDKCVR